jgi:hypothetical protein
VDHRLAVHLGDLEGQLEQILQAQLVTVGGHQARQVVLGLFPDVNLYLPSMTVLLSLRLLNALLKCLLPYNKRSPHSVLKQQFL